jgi:hypothetical protein
MDGYSVEIKDCSKELTAREKIAIKDTSDATKLDDAVTETAPIVITPVAFAVLAVHNEKSDNKDYEDYIIIDKDGTRYRTGSESFWTTFRDIWYDMSGEDEEYSIKAYKLPSKNRQGKYFLTCSII